MQGTPPPHPPSCGFSETFRPFKSVLADLLQLQTDGMVCPNLRV